MKKIPYDAMKVLVEEIKKNLDVYQLDSIKIGIGVIECKEIPRNINVLITDIIEEEKLDVFFFIIKLKNKIVIYAKTTVDDINLVKLFKNYRIKGNKSNLVVSTFDTPSKVKRFIIENLKTSYKPTSKAKHIMTHPVRTEFANEPIEKIYRVMLQTGHNGIPLIENDKVVGIVTRKDVEKAIKHGLKNKPVKDIMNKNIITVESETSLSQVRKLMIENGVGRVLVVENGELVGIITRSDLIRGFEPKDFVIKKLEISKKNVFEKMKENLPKKILNILRLLGVLGEEKHLNTYIVGGFVRDLLLGVKNFDIDIVVEGNIDKAALHFAKYVSEELEGKMVEHEEFATASVFLKDKIRIDIATARTEYYEKPAVLPKVEMSSIKKDLYRRDFSINAMAIKLNPGEFGVLLDFFGCYRDLKLGIIRTLYNLSFVEDPTRILRAIRFKIRFNFKIEENTLNLLKKAVEENYIERVTGMRIREELMKILEEKNFDKAFLEMGRLRILDHVFEGFKYDSESEKLLSSFFNLLDWYNKNLKDKCGEIHTLYSMSLIIFSKISKENFDFLMKRYGYPKKFKNMLFKYIEGVKILRDLNLKNIKPSDLFDLFNETDQNVLIPIFSNFEGNDLEILKGIYIRFCKSKLEKISGRNLIECGIKEGKIIRKILEEIRKRRMDDPSSNEMDIFNKIVKDYCSSQ